jgi:TM2 domain-containing membrane protein YozV
MDSNKVDMYIMTNAKFFDGDKVPMIRERLLVADDSKWILLQSQQLKDPTTMLIVSILGGHWGIDRFMLGETGLGIAKLLTCGGMGIWTIIDFFMIQGNTREKNMQKIQPFLY